mmetsp:Transcript_3345/g.8652  ORF Transcript_3345/g.8652 Transcript_3345/m.8652 type:complete len:254 (-) Transcript_3345:186-947(-)
MAQTRGGCLARLLPRGRLVRTASRKSGQPIAVRDVVSTEPRKRHVAGLRVAELAAELRKRNAAVAVARPQVGRVLERLSRLAVAKGEREEQPLRAPILRREVGGASVYCAHVKECSVAGFEHRVAPLDLSQHRATPAVGVLRAVDDGLPLHVILVRARQEERRAHAEGHVLRSDEDAEEARPLRVGRVAVQRLPRGARLGAQCDEIVELRLAAAACGLEEPPQLRPWGQELLQNLHHRAACNVAEDRSLVTQR